MQTQHLWDATTEYRASYVSHSGILNRKNKRYEEVVARKMQEIPESNSVRADAHEENCYELLVRNKMSNCAVHDPSDMHDNPESSTSKGDLQTEEELNGISMPNSEDQPKETNQKRKCGSKDKRVKVMKATYDPSHLNRKRSQNTVKSTSSEVGGVIKPKFFRNRDYATEEEKKHLYGPFYVAWPKNKQMPSSYEELAKIYGRRYQ